MQIVYCGMTRPELDLAYSNSSRVADFPGLMQQMRAESAAFYAARDCRRDLRYGPGPRETFDWFSCGADGAPTLVFVHGGYWQSCDKEDFAFVAAGPLQRGFNVVLAEYRLAPDTDMTGIVAQIGALLDHLAQDPAGLGTRGRPVCLSGHSAGGHLAAVHRSHPAVESVLAISGLYDLLPISLGALNDKLRLTAQQVADHSPQVHVTKGAPMVVAVGANELPELIRQSDDYAQVCTQAGERVQLLHVPGRDHFNILHDLADPDGHMLQALIQIRAGG